MDLTKLIKLIKTHWIVFLAAAIVVTPIEYKIISIHYQGRIETLKSHIDLLKEEKQFLVDKLKQIDSPSENKSVHFPEIQNENKITKDEVRDLAWFYGLFNRWSANPHLQFKEGDISYWYEQGFSKKDLVREFESRSIALRRAEKSGEKIPSHGDLSHKAEQLQRTFRSL